MKKIEQMKEIAPNVFQASAKCFYIRIANGELKFCIKERLEKLLKRHNGNYEELVAQYRVRNTDKSIQEAPVAASPATN